MMEDEMNGTVSSSLKRPGQDVEMMPEKRPKQDEDLEFLSWQLWVHAGYNTKSSTELLKEYISRGANVNCCLKPSITENMKPDQESTLNRHKFFCSDLYVAAIVKSICKVVTQTYYGLPGTKIVEQQDIQEIEVETCDVQTQAARSPLHQAAAAGNVESCKALLEAEAEYSATDEMDHTALHVSSFYGSSEVCELLITKGADPDAVDKMGRTPLHYASMGGHVEICKLLLKANASKGVTDSYDKTPLHWATCCYRSECVKLLVNAIVALDAMDKDSKSALHYACDDEATRIDSIAICHVLVSAGANVNVFDKHDRSPLHYASINRSLERCQLLLAKNPDIDAIDEDRKTALHYSCDQDARIATSAAICKELMDKGADPNASDKLEMTALHYAVKHKSLDKCQLLMNRKLRNVDVNAKDKDGETALWMALGDETELTIFQALLAGKADPNVKKDGQPILHEAIICHGLKYVSLLVTHGADVNATGKEEESVMHHVACQKDETDTVAIMQLLIDSKADVNATDKNGHTPLMLAHKPEVVRMLLHHVADVNIADEDGNTALHHHSAKEENTTNLLRLLDCGANVLSQNKVERGPLHIAAKQSDEYTCWLLLKCGAYIKAVDQDGNTPLHMAAQRGDEKVCERLLKSGADVFVKNNDNQQPLTVWPTNPGNEPAVFAEAIKAATSGNENHMES
ncbi:uncharacterized protein [Amphiura filiformis]|uniref:uncharacterized protein n=1 Tax=Amphiura filiformis TaxID=82378 RepID=UPI003B216B6F